MRVALFFVTPLRWKGRALLFSHLFYSARLRQNDSTIWSAPPSGRNVHGKPFYSAREAAICSTGNRKGIMLSETSAMKRCARLRRFNGLEMFDRLVISGSEFSYSSHSQNPIRGERRTR